LALHERFTAKLEYDEELSVQLRVLQVAQWMEHCRNLLLLAINDKNSLFQVENVASHTVSMSMALVHCTRSENQKLKKNVKCLTLLR